MSHRHRHPQRRRMLQSIPLARDVRRGGAVPPAPPPPPSTPGHIRSGVGRLLEDLARRSPGAGSTEIRQPPSPDVRDLFGQRGYTFVVRGGRHHLVWDTAAWRQESQQQWPDLQARPRELSVTRSVVGCTQLLDLHADGQHAATLSLLPDAPGEVQLLIHATGHRGLATLLSRAAHELARLGDGQAATLTFSAQPWPPHELGRLQARGSVLPALVTRLGFQSVTAENTPADLDAADVLTPTTLTPTTLTPTTLTLGLRRDGSELAHLDVFGPAGRLGTVSVFQGVVRTQAERGLPGAYTTGVLTLLGGHAHALVRMVDTLGGMQFSPQPWAAGVQGTLIVLDPGLIQLPAQLGLTSLNPVGLPKGATGSYTGS